VGIDLRYTTLEKGDKVFLIPNSTLFTNPISLTRITPPSPVPSPPAAPTANPRSLIGPDGDGDAADSVVNRERTL